MGQEKFNYKKKYPKKEKSFRIKLFAFICFLIILGLIFMNPFYNSKGITGNVINSLNENKSIDFRTSFLISELELSGRYEEIIISIKRDSLINLKDQEIELNKFENEIILKDFEGIIEIKEDTIKKLDGKASEIKINNIPLISKKIKKLEFSIIENSTYNFLEIKEKIFLKDFSFNASGRIDFKEDSLNLNSEKITFANYFGNLKIENKKLILHGLTENIKIQGKSRKIIFSKD